MVLLLPGTISRLAPTRCDGEVANRTRTPGSRASGSTSSKFAIRGGLTTTMSRRAPLDAGAASSRSSEASAGTRPPSRDGTPPRTGNPVRRAESREALGDDGQQRAALRSVLTERETPDRPAAHHDLRAVLTLGLQEDRVHVDGRLDAGGLRLRGLGPADLAPVGGDGGVERHVLRLERRDTIALPGEDPAERRGEQALADPRRSALHHQTRRRHAR